MYQQTFIDGRICVRPWATIKNDKDHCTHTHPCPTLVLTQFLPTPSCTSLYFDSLILYRKFLIHLTAISQTLDLYRIQDLHQKFSKALVIAVTICYWKDPHKAMLKRGDSVSSNINYVKVLTGMVCLSMLRLKRSYRDNWLLFSLGSVFPELVFPTTKFQLSLMPVLHYQIQTPEILT